jgi:hypothetical protein
LRRDAGVVIVVGMDDERKPKEDLKEGLGLLFRAARGAVKQVDIGKIDKELDKAFHQVGRVVTNVGRVVGDEINRMANNPPWQKGDPPAETAAPAAKSEQDKKPDQEGEAHASPSTPEANKDKDVKSQDPGDKSAN